MSNQKNDQPSLTDQLSQLDELLSWFEREDFDVEEALKKYEAGMALTQQISGRLHGIENKVEVLKKRFDQEA